MAQQEAAAALQAPSGAKLYRYVRGGTEPWKLASSTAVPHFYDAQEAGRVSPEDYYLEIEAGRIDVHVDGELQHVADVTQQRITFAADGELWALKFASEEGYQKFYTKLMDCMFYNGCLGDGNRVEADPEPMEIDERSDQPDRGEWPSRHQEQQQEVAGNPIAGLVMGGLDNSYLLQGNNTFHVLWNAEGGVEAAGTSFSFTPAAGSGGSKKGGSTPAGGFMPAKMLLGDRS